MHKRSLFHWFRQPALSVWRLLVYPAPKAACLYHRGPASSLPPRFQVTANNLMIPETDAILLPSKLGLMNKFYRLVIILSGILLTASQVSEAQSRSASSSNGILYKITGKGLKKPSYLFGTVHVICQQDMFSKEKLAAYLGQTERLVMELDLDNLGEIAEMAKGISLPDGKTLKNILTPEQYAKVDEMVMNSLGFHAENVQSISPVALQVMILSSPKMLGCSSPSAYEITLTNLAKAANKPVEGLETADFQRQT